jgi:hypothetical protein
MGSRVIDISTPSNPKEVDYYDTPGRAWDVAVTGNYAYVADGEAGLQIYKNLLAGVENREKRKPAIVLLYQNEPNPFVGFPHPHSFLTKYILGRKGRVHFCCAVKSIIFFIKNLLLPGLSTH